jgi:hypothetical protein
MAYVGQGIKGGTFSVLDTSGNTYNGSNVTFNLGTQVGSPAQLLVSHDGVIQKPVTDYTIATGGTQITFTTAPASGASIFITEISGAVGAPMNRDINGDELILDADADTSITADTDDQIDIKIAGADDFSFTANTFTAAAGSSISSPDYSGGAVFNEGSADVDFRIEGNGEANLFYVDAGEDKIYSGIAAKSVHAAGYEPHIQIEGTGDNKNSVSLTQNSNNNGAPAIIMCKTRGTAVGATTVVQDNDYLGNIMFGGADGTDRQTYGAHIIARVDGTPGGNDMPTELKFGVTADGAASPTDRLVILPAGAVKATSRVIIDNEVVAAFKLNIEAGGDNESGIIINDKDAASNFPFLSMRRSGTVIGSVERNGSNDAVSYQTSSDYRLKQSEENITDGITRIKQLKPYKFNWKSNPSANKVDGFFAHEVQSVIPEAISGTKDATETLQKVVLSASGDVVRTNIEQADWTHGKTEEGGEIYASNTTWEATKQIIKPQGIDQSKLVPLLTAALKEAITEIESLKARVTTLEG